MDNSHIRNIQNSQFVNNGANKSKMEKENKKPDSVIENIIHSTASFNSLTDANSYLDKLGQNNPDVIKLDFNEYKYKDFYISTGKKFVNDRHAKGLGIAEKLHLSCAPELIDYKATKNGTDYVMVTRVEGTEKENVLPYRSCKQDVSLDAKSKFMEDIEKFIGMGYTNKAIESSANWFVVPSTKRIIVGNWSEFVTLGDDENKAHYRKNIADTLGLIY